MSWFSDFSKAAGDLTQRAGDLTASLAEKAKKAIPMDAATLQKLTLTTPELIAERERIDAEEKRKAAVKESLSGMFPWETKDREREILVEECKEAILSLSGDAATFFGPYTMPALNVNVEEEKTEEEQLAEEEEGITQVAKDRMPTAKQLENLTKLEPLPPLLRDFDLDAHVGLIQKLLKVDPRLVDCQSTLSGGGNRERIFWQNYFFHCAFTRYEAGLSVDEIWSDQTGNVEASTAAAAIAAAEAEEEITFDDAPSDEVVAAAAPSTMTDASTTKSSTLFTQMNPPSDTQEVDEPATPTDFEMVGDEGDAEMDELEAEIARELGD